MNQVFVGGIALIIAFILWSSKKESKGSPLLKSEKDSLANRNETTSFVQKNKSINPKGTKNLKDLKFKPFLNELSLNSIETQKKLTKLISSNPNDRLLAIQIASKWENKKVMQKLI